MVSSNRDYQVNVYEGKAASFRVSTWPQDPDERDVAADRKYFCDGLDGRPLHRQVDGQDRPGVSCKRQ